MEKNVVKQIEDKEEEMFEFNLDDIANNRGSENKKGTKATVVHGDTISED